ncbi:MAG: hypothetical protein LBG80_19815 [Bacteroidales bacterium]|nr:hypothetical protein [Bacteroidales bacterium]
MDNIKFDFSMSLLEDRYLLNFCEVIFQKYNYKQAPAYKGMTERMVYEPEIWAIGATIEEELKKTRNKKINSSKLLNGILSVIHTEKYRNGRQSFVMLLHYFKNNHIVIEELERLLNDKSLYGFAVGELNKLKEYKYINIVKEILDAEKSSWIKKDAQKYLLNAQKTK